MANIFAQQITWIYTYDLPSTARFYAEGLGLEQVLDQGMCRVFRATPHSFIGVCQRPDRHVEPKGVILTLLTKDVDGWRRRMGDYGAHIETEPSYSERAQAYAFFCRDPEGYRIEFQEFRDPRWIWPDPSGATP
ncbi:VOC family protein [Prosthecomicrobium sp. N25]|uniref:VOC family protein n=1 Tax=Prosthecomicrobium sp. N25 TaxID=3129254 RepID=UPI003076F323